jgi:hypothetical protein
LNSSTILKKSLLFIPDISGFTKFLNETEIIHGVHIIAELLEIIIKNNKLDLKVSEIEGDAILFYKIGEKPTINEIITQCERMFLAFHQHLKLYERDRICDCGSCSNTSNLTLKFIVHYGDVVERNILGHFQLMGSEVTTAHKLMKNNISIHEYLLFSENAVSLTDSKNIPSWFKILDGNENYNDVGNVKYKYGYLTDLLSKVPEPKKRKDLLAVINPLTFKNSINCNINDAYKLLSSLERKPEWVMGLKSVKYDANKTERIGTQHECLLPLNSLEIETSKNEVQEDKIIYAETVNPSGIYPAFSQVFILEKVSETACNISVEIHHHSSFLKKFIFEMAMGGAIKKSLVKFKKICETEKMSNAEQKQ